MNTKQQQILRRVFDRPTPGNIRWEDIVSLFKALGASIDYRGGSAIVVELRGETDYFHSPHPEKMTPKPKVRAVRDFLERAGVMP